MVHIGTAGWHIPLTVRESFPSENSLLKRYSLRFNAVEINSSFYRFHRQTTYERWAASTPPNFLFAVKIPLEITHRHRLVNIEAPLAQFLDGVSGLGVKLGPLLIQLPPSLNFEQKIVNNFFKLLRYKFKGKVALEPRHISWANSDTRSTFAEFNIVQVSSDLLLDPSQQESQSFEYYRLHGFPKIYESSYNNLFLNQLAAHISDASWVIFDNTKFGAAIENAISLKNLFKNESM